MKTQATRIQWALCFLLFLGNVSVQFYLYRDALNNGIENRSSPSSTDTQDYVNRANLLSGTGADGGVNVDGGNGADGAFRRAFADGHRTPAYPVFLAAFHPLFQAPLKAARAAQILLAAAIIVLSFPTFLNLLGPIPGVGKKALGATALVALWPPLYHFSPVLIAETCSLFVFSALLLALSFQPGPSSRFATRAGWAAAPLLFATLVLLKPNHFLLLFPIALFLWMRGIEGMRGIDGMRNSGVAKIRSGRPTIRFVLLSLVLLAPWSAFLSKQQGRPVFLSTASSVNAYLGTGVVQDVKDANTLPYRYARHYAQRFANDPKVVRDSRGAAEIWLKHPVRTGIYGLTKVLHGFGFSLRGLGDALLVALLAASLFFSRRLWKARSDRAWGLFFWGVLFVTCFQLFVYLPNQRLKTVLFDLPALLVIGLGLFRDRSVASKFNREPD